MFRKSFLESRGSREYNINLDEVDSQGQLEQ
jgi:hypothetical protein